MSGEVEQRFKIGTVQATVWKNKTPKGTFRSISLTKSYLKDGEWKNTSAISGQDLEKAIQVLELAKDFLNEEIPA